MGGQVESYRWVMLVLVWMAGFALALPMFAYPPLLPEITADLSLSAVETVLLMSLPTLAFTSFQLVGGVSADRLGVRKTMGLGLAVLSVSTLLSAAAGSSVVEEAARLLVGVGIGLGGVCVVKVLSDWFPRGELSMAVGVQSTGWAAGNAAGLFFPVVLRDVLGGWRGPVYVFGLFGCVVTGVFVVLARERVSGSVGRGLGEAVPGILRLREFWFLTLAQLGFLASNTAVITWLPTALMDSGWGAEAAALAAALTALIGIPANLAGGVVSDWLGRRKPVLLVSGVALGLSTAVLGFVLDGGLMWLVVCVLGWFTFFFTGPFFATPACLVEVGAERVGTLVGLMMLLSSAGGFASPILFGVLRDSTGSYVSSFLLSAGFLAPLVMMGLFCRETGSKAS